MKLSRSLRLSTLLLSPVLALVALTGCSTSSSADNVQGADAAAAADAPWSYTDATGKTVNLDHRPTAVASFSDYALGLLSYGIDPVAIFGRVDVASDPRFEPYDISKTAIIGNSYGEIDLEKLTEAAPDLIVTGIYPTDREGTLDLTGPLYGFADTEQQSQLEKIAPVVAITVGGKGIDVIESVNRLAESLGTSADTVADAKAKYETAAADLTAAAASNPIQITQLYADADGIYVVKPADEPETQLYQSLGVNFTNKNPDGYYYWDIYSWENAAQVFGSDVLLTNVEGFQKDDLLAQPTFASDPALVAGQIHSWNGGALDYASQAAHMNELAEIIRSSKKL